MTEDIIITNNNNNNNNVGINSGNTREDIARSGGENKSQTIAVTPAINNQNNQNGRAKAVNNGGENRGQAIAGTPTNNNQNNQNSRAKVVNNGGENRGQTIAGTPANNNRNNQNSRAKVVNNGGENRGQAIAGTPANNNQNNQNSGVIVANNGAINATQSTDNVRDNKRKYPFFKNRERTVKTDNPSSVPFSENPNSVEPNQKIEQGNRLGKNNNRIKVIFLGGIDEIGKNMTAIEYNGQIVIIDAGMTFPTAEMPGVEVIIPDMTYLVENRAKIKGLLLTHGHEDHIGATPFLVRSVPKIAIYGSKLTLALVEHKIRENRLEMPKMVVCEGKTQEQVGCFKVEFIKVTHSISGAFALAITAPNGEVVFHTGDFKVDYTPIDGQMMDISRISEIGKRGVLLMLGESTNVERHGSTMSERTVGESLRNIFSENANKRIIIATFASNVHRVQQIIDIAAASGRRVALSGRSMLNIAEMAIRIGELKVGKDVLVDIDKIDGIPYDKLTIVATGSQGEPMSALYRMSEGSFNKVVIGKNDTVVLSSSPIPGNERTVYSVINNLYRAGADVIYDDLRDVHVSGHACQDELKLMLSLVKPKFFIPVHGEYRHLKMHAKLAESLGINEANICLPELGGVFEISKGRLAMTGKVTAGNMFVDGLTIDDMDSGVLKDRKMLAEDGFMIILAGISVGGGAITTGPEIIYRGMCSIDKYLDEFKNIISETIIKSAKYGTDNKAEIITNVKRIASKLIRTKVKQSPMIVPIIFDN